MKKLLLIPVILIAQNSFSAIKTVIANAGTGWGQATNWSPAGVPVSGDEVVLSVKLISFTARNQSFKVVLNWQTAEENNYKNFHIEKSSDLISWKTIHTTKARGSASSYSWIDNDPKVGVNYYRLKSVDIDNKSQLSKIVKVNHASLADIQIGPNPATSTLYVSLPLPSTSSYSVEIFNLSGQLLKKKSGSQASGIIKVDLEDLVNNNYIVLLRQGNDVLVKKQFSVRK